MQAAQACSTCRRQKRRCDKQLPECSLCKHVGRACTYDNPGNNGANGAEGAAAFQALQDKVALLERHVVSLSTSPSTATSVGTTSNSTHTPASTPSSETSGSSSHSGRGLPFPSAFFLDGSIYRHLGTLYDNSNIPLAPAGMLHYLDGGEVNLAKLCEAYFSTAHRWLPFISRVRLLQYLQVRAGGSLSPGRDEMDGQGDLLLKLGLDKALLLICMKLLVGAEHKYGQSQAQNPLYEAAKSFLAQLEARNIFSLAVMQAALLIAVFEIAHGIYPAAYLSVAHCAALGHAYGFNERKTAVQMLPPPISWTEQEERRRIWWAVIVLDRFVLLGSMGRPPAAAELSLDEHLPVDDDSWDKGVPIAGNGLAVSLNIEEKASSFARTCQAIHYLGQVIRHLNSPIIDLEMRFEDALGLANLGNTLMSSLLFEFHRLPMTLEDNIWTAVAICLSTLIKLFDAYSCTESAPAAVRCQPAMQKAAVNGLRQVTQEIAAFTVALEPVILVQGLESMSPLICECIYAGAMTGGWFVAENGDQSAASMMEPMVRVLETVAPRWQLASTYLGILAQMASRSQSAGS